MPIYKEKGQKKYKVRVNFVDQDGTYKAKYGTASSYAEAAKKYQELYEGRYSIKRITLGKLCESYLLHAQENNRLASVRIYKWLLNVILRTIDRNMYIEDISPSFVREWQTKMLQAGYAVSYVQKVNRMLSTLMRYGEAYYGLQKNSVKLAGRLPAVNPTEREFYTLDEFKRFLNGIDKEKDISYWVVFNVLFYSGCRIGEIMALYPSDIDFQKRSISITKTFYHIDGQSYIGPPKTEKSIRNVTIPPFLLRILQDHIQRLPDPSVRIFFNLTVAGIRNKIVQVCNKTGVKRIRVHDFRHSAISFLVSKEVPMLEISRRVGHASADITYQVYAHLYPERDREIADREDEDFKKWEI